MRRSAHATVAVGERVDRLELGVRDPGLDDRREIGSGGERAKIVEQRPNVLWRRRHVGRADRVVVVPADPVL